MPANATERAVRDQLRAPKPDGLYRAELRRAAQGQDEKAPVPNAVPLSGIRMATRQAVALGWQVLAQIAKEISRARAEERKHAIQSPVPSSPAPPRAQPAPRIQEFERDGYSR